MSATWNRAQLWLELCMSTTSWLGAREGSPCLDCWGGALLCEWEMWGIPKSTWSWEVLPVSGIPLQHSWGRRDGALPAVYSMQNQQQQCCASSKGSEGSAALWGNGWGQWEGLVTQTAQLTAHLTPPACQGALAERLLRGWAVSDIGCGTSNTFPCSAPPDRRGFTSGRGFAGDPQPVESWPSIWSVTGVGTWSCSCGRSQSRWDEVHPAFVHPAFVPTLLQQWECRQDLDQQKALARIYQKFSDKSKLWEAVCIESALCITCLWHFGSNIKSLSARFTVLINHNFSLCPAGQNQEGKALFQASMKYLETRKNIWMGEKNKKKQGGWWHLLNPLSINKDVISE